MKFNNPKIRQAKDPEVRRELIRHHHLEKYPDETTVFIMSVPKRPFIGHMLRAGFKICSQCNYMIDTQEYFCSLCGKKFRTRIMNPASTLSKSNRSSKRRKILGQIKIQGLVSGEFTSLYDYMKTRGL